MSYLLAQASAHRIPLKAESVQCVVTSPPYWGLRAYAGEQEVGDWGCALGLEPTPGLYVEHMVEVFREVRRVLRKDGTLWLNLGDSYAAGGTGAAARGFREGLSEQGLSSWSTRAEYGRVATAVSGLKPKDLVGIPWRVAFALQADGWYLRSDIIWAKPNPMPESVTDRPTKSHEYLFLLTKSERYYYDADAIRDQAIYAGKEVRTNGNEGMDAGYDGNRTRDGFRRGVTVATHRSARSVWNIATQPYGSTKAVRWVAADAGVEGGDIRRTPSPDCPVHEGSPDPVPTASGDVREGASAEPRRSPDIDGRRVPGQLGALAPTAPLHVADFEVDSSGSPHPARSPAATSRSTGSRKTGRAPATIPPYTPSAQSGRRTDDTSTEPDSSDSVDRTLGSNIAPVDSGDHLSVQTQPRNVDTSSCTCSWQRRVTESVSHFATFPEAIPERCIKAGSAAQACAVCGAPWERVTERVRTLDGQPADLPPMKNNSKEAPSGAQGVGHWRLGTRITEHGWRPTCAHEDGSGKSVVLDPFNGSGTTGAVALSLGRRYVGLDLSRSYLSEQALARVDPLAAAAQGARNGTSAQGVLAL